MVIAPLWLVVYDSGSIMPQGVVHFPDQALAILCSGLVKE
jgi:hypothetical protein